jgi:hypothetical protein
VIAATWALVCPRCGRELPPESLQPTGARCTGCDAHVEGLAFPALFRSTETSVSEPVVSSEAACFFHPNRVAAFACSRCGRFLCPLCRISWGGADVCTACLEAANRAGESRPLATSRFHFDSLALALSTFPLLIWFFSMFTAPATLGLALFTWRRESSIVPRSKIRFVAAIVLSLLTIAAWIAFWIYIVRYSYPRPRQIG